MNNKIEEDDFYDTMMQQLLSIVTRPLYVSDGDVIGSEISSAPTRWRQVKDPAPSESLSISPESSTFKNLFSWKLFTKGHRHSVVVSTTAVSTESFTEIKRGAAEPELGAVGGVGAVGEVFDFIRNS